jgi:hypothetical protein
MVDVLLMQALLKAVWAPTGAMITLAELSWRRPALCLVTWRSSNTLSYINRHYGEW